MHSSDERTQIDGSCHCGAVRFTVLVDPNNGLFVRCNCSLCTRKTRGVAVLGIDQFILVGGAERLKSYRWNTERENHYFCSQCGIHTHHTLADAPPRVGVNLACCPSLSADTIAWIDGDGASLPLVQ